MTTKVPPTEAGSTDARTASEDRQILRDRPRVEQPPPRDGHPPPDDEQPAPRCPRVHLIIGPVGAGKSTYALDLTRRHRALRLTLDEWMTDLFSPDRPPSGVVAWYVERAARCVDRIWRVAEGALAVGVDVVLEIGLLRRAERAAFYLRVLEAGFDGSLTVHVVDAPREVRRARVERRNRERGQTFAMVVPLEVFELASDLWEPLDDEEQAQHDVRVTWTDCTLRRTPAPEENPR